MSTSSCNDGISKLKSNNDGVCEVNDMLQNMNMSMVAEDDIVVSVCANCGKEDANNICNKCKQVKYCNAACKKKHRHKHKNDCEEHVRIATENAAKLHDEKLFKQPPPDEDCPICFQQLPLLHTGWKYKTCCGKVICSGCSYAPVYDDRGNKVDIVKQNQCAFCRVVAPKTDEEIMKRIMKRVEVNHEKAIADLGSYYRYGIYGMPQDSTKALELFHRSVGLGYAEAYNGIGYAYELGEGVEVDMEKANHYYELAAIGGSATARHYLGVNEAKAGNIDRALKHFMIAVGGGYADSPNKIRDLYTSGQATKDDYTRALEAYQEYLLEIKSEQRDEAAAFNSEKYRYY